MIERIEGFIDERQTFEVHCDFCSHYQTYEDVYSWDDLIESMKKDGWESIHVKDETRIEWQHKCLTCQYKEKEKS